MSEYDRIASAIDFITSRADAQPSLEEIAAHVHLSAFHFQRLFCRWTGTSPKRLLQVLTLERSKVLLGERPVLAVADAVGLSSASRLHDHFVQLEAVSPGQFRRRGEGLTLHHGVHETPFGPLLMASTERGICHAAFIGPDGCSSALDALQQEWPAARLQADATATARAAEHLRQAGRQPKDRPVSLQVSGTSFQVAVWRALLRIPQGEVTSYGEVARSIGRPGAARAVGSAVAANPVALFIPCHRVIRESGALGEYNWGSTRKYAAQVHELAQLADASTIPQSVHSAAD